MSNESSDSSQNSVTITIDGRSYTVDDRHQEAAALLRLAGADPAQYDLGKIKQDGEPHVFRDDHPVELHDGDKFVTVRQSASVA